ncbi:MAG TPA: hypothetical protein VGO91_19230 [Pyrinomonadaceae bacterium]|jgi:hypothetical protein|nr:hypothetical protein [Pyrinomonadaceae bacterium]
MSNDELEKKMEFIVEHLAALTARQEKTEDLLGRLATASLDRMTDLDNKVSALVDAQIKTEGNMSALAEAQLRTDERLNVFITVIERYISSESNGESHGSD